MNQGHNRYNYDQQQVDVDYGHEQDDDDQQHHQRYANQHQQQYDDEEEDNQQLVIDGQAETNRQNQFNITYNNDDDEEDHDAGNNNQYYKNQQQNYQDDDEEELDIEFEQTPREEEGFDKTQTQKLQSNQKYNQTQNDSEDDDDDDDNPMEKRLRKMKQQMRNQIQVTDSKNSTQRKAFKDEDEDNQGYDDYRSPQQDNKNFNFTQLQKPGDGPKVQNTFRESSQITSQQNQNIKEEQKATSGAVISSGSQIAAGYGAANFDKIKNSKLFQKFMQKETGQKQDTKSTCNLAVSATQNKEQQDLKSNSSKVSLQKQISPSTQAKKEKTNEKLNSTEKQRKGWAAQNTQAQEKNIEQLLNASNMTHDDYFEQKHKQQIFQTNQRLETSTNQQLGGGNTQINNFMDDSQFYNNLKNLPEEGHQLQFDANMYGGVYAKNHLEDKNYLLDHSDFNNEGELVGYSEQIIGKINDMAPGIPNQDEVLCHQPPETFVNLMHDQFNNEVQWMVGSKFPNSQNPSIAQDKNQLGFSNKPQAYDFQKIEPMRQDIGNIREEMHFLQSEFDLANERFTNLKEKYDKLQYDYTKDKKFYEEALEVRMNQLEALENENEILQRKLEESKRSELDQQAKNDQLEFDMDMLRRNMSSGQNEKATLSKKEEAMNREIQSLQEELREKDYEIEGMQRDSQKLRNQIERANQEVERMRQSYEFSEQTIEQKDHEKQGLQSQISELKMRIQQQQQDFQFQQEENQDLRNEIRLLNQKLGNSNDVQEQLKSQVFDLKERANEMEHSQFLDKSSNEMMQKEIQQLRQQLQKANQFIQQQATFYQQNSNSLPRGDAVPTFSVPQSNYDDYANTMPTRKVANTRATVNSRFNRDINNDRDIDTHSQQSSTTSSHNMNYNIRESAVPTTISPKKGGESNIFGGGRVQQETTSSIAFPSKSGVNRQQQNQLKSQELGSILQWSEKGTSGANINSNVRSTRQPMNMQEEPMNNQNIPGGRRANITNKTNMQSQDDDLGGARQNSIKAVDQAPGKKSQATAQQAKEFESKQKQIQTIENNLMQLNIEKDKYKNEYGKIPENPKTIAQKRRKQELETELQILGKNIASLKSKLRDCGALQ
eukprot:403361104